MRPLKPRNPRFLQLSGAARRRGAISGEGAGGRGESAGRCGAARGKPISQIIGLDPTVLPRYPAFIPLPDWGRGAGRRRRGSNYGCYCPVAGRWRRAGPGRAGPGGAERSGDRGSGIGDREREPRAGRPGNTAPRPQPRPCAPRGLLSPPAQLPHCLLWSLPLPCPPSLPLLSPLLPKERRASVWRE